ncbi:HisA/HisF-related TIM barrel protein, partial [Luminiphilus sp.]|nr:HisA/HisF-related TIM barrel protein [Luminiphilus sp.]
MLKTRVIPCLLLSNGGLVKTVKFSNPKYIGDPINAVRIFNEKEVDELVFLDIDATKNNSSPNFELLGRISSEAFMPFSYGGGIKSLDQVKKLFALGVEKVV